MTTDESHYAQLGQGLYPYPSINSNTSFPAQIQRQSSTGSCPSSPFAFMDTSPKIPLQPQFSYDFGTVRSTRGNTIYRGLSPPPSIITALPQSEEDAAIYEEDELLPPKTPLPPTTPIKVITCNENIFFKPMNDTYGTENCSLLQVSQRRSSVSATPSSNNFPVNFPSLPTCPIPRSNSQVRRQETSENVYVDPTQKPTSSPGIEVRNSQMSDATNSTQRQTQALLNENVYLIPRN